MAIYQLEDKVPRIDETAWVAESACVIGDVTIGAHASVWPGAVLRGDDEPITVGDGSNIQDNCVLHTDRGAPLVVGRDVTVGHMAILHGCTVEDGCLIGMGATVLNRATVRANALVGAGSLVSQGKTVEAGTLALGRPARFVRRLSDEEIAALRRGAPHYRAAKDRMRAGLKRVG